jgi:hypothetical protein
MGTTVTIMRGGSAFFGWSGTFLFIVVPMRFHTGYIGRLSDGGQGAGPTRVLLMGSAGLRAGE